MTRVVGRDGIGAGIVAGLVMVLAACGSAATPIGTPGSPPGSVTPAPSATASASPLGPTPLVIDTDLSSDDTMALPFLLSRASSTSPPTRSSKHRAQST